MSVEAITWAFEQRDLNDGEARLLVVIANAAGPDGVAFGGQRLYAEVCECGERTIQRRMQSLEDRGLLARTRRKRQNGSRTSDWQVLAPVGDRSKMAELDPDERPEEVLALVGNPTAVSGNQPDSRDGVTRQPTPTLPDTAVSPPEPLEEPSVEPSEAQAAIEIGDDGSQTTAFAPDEYANALPEVQTCLDKVARNKGVARPRPEALLAAMRRHDISRYGGDFVAEARNIEFWWIHGNGQRKKPKVLAQFFANWIARTLAELRKQNRQGEVDVAGEVVAAYDHVSEGVEVDQASELLAAFEGRD